MEKTTLLYKKIQFILGVVLLSVPFINTTNAQVTITKPNLIIETCSFPSAYTTLENIVISETSVSDFNDHPSSRTIILTAPSNFEFNTSPSPATTISAATGKDITGTPTITINSTTQITITYSCETDTELDELIISGIQIRALTTASSGNITRTGGNGVIDGLVNTTTLTNTLTSTLLTVPAQPSAISGNASPCLGTSQTYSVTNVAGTTYNWVFPAGWSQTAGGTTNSIIVTIGATSGNITVTPSNTCGNGTATQMVTVSDTVNPTINAPANVNVNTNTACTATGVVLTTPTTADNCSVASVTNNHPSTTYSLGNTTVTWTVTDGAG
ncbi:MAG: HYR domain-containing protein, partial [Lentimicrobium sp.]|nr:HYR domain-containing protein [Lentimicrobium sp.]